MPTRHLLLPALLATLTACGGSASGDHFSIEINPPQNCPSAQCDTGVTGSGPPGNVDGSGASAPDRTRDITLR